ncbi:hypothetical protein AMATHDRAFT_51709 [Amanita thiersii Skay4041]|uniref:Uncharacterized protein n=1 Tax=Amanita thiersii Skay4041 TaxID=703135 RepID=A0A2A9N688_9AGAR|nr:hypothetical protein AMATHDRAFT_51709 [Amanita thiersii Skay4041]
MPGSAFLEMRHLTIFAIATMLVIVSGAAIIEPLTCKNLPRGCNCTSPSMVSLYAIEHCKKWNETVPTPLPDGGQIKSMTEWDSQAHCVWAASAIVRTCSQVRGGNFIVEEMKNEMDIEFCACFT